MPIRLRIKRGTRSQVDAAASSGTLIAGEPYLLTDSSTLAIGLTTTTYRICAPTDSPALSGTPTAPTAAAGTNNTQLATTAFAARAASDAAAGLIPVGAVQAFAGATAPSGWLECNGAAVSRTTYAALFAVLGTTYGAGNGSTTFNLPDLRGEFLRGWDNGRGVDASRARGSAQGSAMPSHYHRMPFGWDSTATQIYLYHWNSGANQPAFGSEVVAGALGNNPVLSVNQNNGNIRLGYTEGATVSTGESRPRNVAMMYIIRAI